MVLNYCREVEIIEDKDMRLSWPSKTCIISRFVHLALREMTKLKRKDRFVTITYHTDEFVQTFTTETIFSK